ncbi:MAG: hypothetical protein II566_06000 [Lachnospiraceae bacterium]|nr:hypothetical protein [Lachnospiraceae bacterium]
MKGYESILMAEKGRYRNLKFNLKDLSSTGGYYRDYHIPEDETMVVYAYRSACSLIEMEGNGTIITDRAIYFHPNHKNWGEENRIPLSSICKYIIFQESGQDGVRLLSKDKKWQIFGHTVAPADTTGSELVELLTCVQQHIMMSDSSERKQYEYALAWALSHVKKSMKERGRLTEKNRKLLKLVGKDAAFRDAAVLVLAEDVYRDMDEEGYRRFLSTLDGVVHKKLLSSLEDPDGLFYASYVQDLSGVLALQLTKSLVKPYGNLLRKMELTLHEAVILCLLCVRMDDPQLFDSMHRAIEKRLSPKRLWQIAGFRAKYSKDKMGVAFEAMLTGNLPTAAFLDLRDDLGFTCLHYALMLRNPQLLIQMLSQKDWGEGQGPIRGRKLLDCAYSYFFVAVQIYSDPKILQLVLAYTKKEARPLLRSIRRIDNFIDIAGKRRYKAKEKLKFFAGEKQKAFHEGRLKDVRRLEEEIAILREEICGCEDRKTELLEMKEEIRLELQTLLVRATAEAKMQAEILRQSDQPLTNYILRLYQEEELLFSTFTKTAISWRVANYKSLFFLLPEGYTTSLPHIDFADQKMVWQGEDEEEKTFEDDVFINPREAERVEKERRREEEKKAKEKARQEQNRKEKAAYQATGENFTSGRKKSWFSEAARCDLSVLKREYHSLVKKYHPDATGNGATAVLLQQIMEERARILENM